MPTIWMAALTVAAFYGAYYVYEPPYRGLYPDLLHEDAFGRSQGVQHILRGIALGIALVGGGFLFKVWHPAPFLLAAAVTTAACGAVVRCVKEDGGDEGHVYKGIRAYVRTSWDIFRHLPNVRMFLFAMVLWEATFAAMRTFVILYITKGLGQSLTVSSLVLLVVAGGYTLAAVLAGPVGDRFGTARVDLLGRDRLRQRPPDRRLRAVVARLVLRDHLPRRDRRRDGDDALLGAPLHADAARAAGCDLGHRDDDEGLGADLRPARRRRVDRRARAAPPGDGGLSGAVAVLRAARARVDPDRRPCVADVAGDGRRAAR